MNETATRKDIDEVIGVIRDFMGQVDERFNEQNKKYDHSWARKVSEQTGIPLENL